MRRRASVADVRSASRAERRVGVLVEELVERRLVQLARFRRNQVEPTVAAQDRAVP